MKYKLRPLYDDGPAFNIYALVRDGACDVEEFLAEVESLDPDEADKVLALLERSARHGPPRNKEKSRCVGGKIFEFKTKSARICYFYDAGKMIICANGFYKPQPKVQDQQIKEAKARYEAYLIAKTNGQIEIESKQ